MKLLLYRKREGACTQVLQIQASDRRLDDIQALRYRVYIEEQGKPLAAADHARRRLCDPLDLAAAHFVALNHDTVIAASRINIFPLSHELVAKADLGLLLDAGISRVAYLSKLAVAPEFRARPTLAARMMIAMFMWGVEHGLEVAFCHCSERLAELYQRLGLIRLEHAWKDPELGVQTILVAFADQCSSLSRFSRGQLMIELPDSLRTRSTAARVLLEQRTSRTLA